MRVIEYGCDRYNQAIGLVYQDNVDVSAEQVSEGMAWVYCKYSKDITLLPLENEAKAQWLGLWDDAAPVPPCEWMHSKR